MVFFFFFFELREKKSRKRERARYGGGSGRGEEAKERAGERHKVAGRIYGWKGRASRAAVAVKKEGKRVEGGRAPSPR